jgi:enamine deaminase RidA (YjgF/YER057c/UK114 family)
MEGADFPGHARRRHGFCLGTAPPFDPETGEILPVPIERQTELILEQMKLCLETAGTSLQNVMKCNIYCTSAKHFPSSMRSTRVTSRKTRPRESSSACRNEPGRSTSRSTAWPWSSRVAVCGSLGASIASPAKRGRYSGFRNVHRRGTLRRVRELQIGCTGASVLIESEPRFQSLFWRVFFPRTGIHFARKRSGA